MSRQGCLKYIFLTMLFFLHFTLKAEETAVVPLPYPENLDPSKVKLGRKFFEDPLFSQNQTLSCNSCHSLQKAGIDGLPRYIGINNQQGMLNTPTVFNARLNFRQFWDGRAKNFNAVIDDHIQDKTIFANDWETILERINKNTDQKATPEIVKEALTAFLNSLMTPNSPFDRYLKGDQKAVSEDVIKGFELFHQYGCVTCHEGPNLGGNLFQRLGIYKDYYDASRPALPSDFGLYNVTKKEEDKFVFKVPMLRNITLTGPYLHDGSVATLEEIIQIMGIYEVGQPIAPYHIPYIIKFLESLNGLDKEK